MRVMQNKDRICQKLDSELLLSLFLFGFSFGKSFNDRDFATVPLA
jgi:hypothetical protein